MNQPTPKMKALARRLIEFETLENSARTDPAALRVCEKLGPQMASILGNAGHRAILSRSLALAHADVKWLAALHVRADGSLEGLEQLESKVPQEAIAEGGLQLLAQLLGLLATFIGEVLTLQLLQQIWPTLSKT